MAGSYNKVVLVGNLTRDPEIRYIASGSAVTKFALAINRRTKQGDETMYVDVVAWDKLGETCNTYLKKGMSCLIEGRLVIRSFDDKDGNKRKATEIVANEMQMLDRKGDVPRGDYDNGGGSGGGMNGGGSRPPAAAGSRSSTAQRDFDDEGLDEEIPF
jgi:single-strand DNA-binding protein